MCRAIRTSFCGSNFFSVCVHSQVCPNSDVVFHNCNWPHVTPSRIINHLKIVTMSGETVNGDDDRVLFSAQILNDLDFSQSCGKYSPEISAQNPGENLILRPLRISDYDKGYIDLLRQLTEVGDISREMFEAQFESMAGCKNCYYIVVVEDTLTHMVIGSGTLVREQKFIRQCSSRGRIEDIVVNDKYRGKQLGKLLVDVLVLLGKQLGCYKISLECKDHLKPFYEQFGLALENKQNYLCRRF